MNGQLESWCVRVFPQINYHFNTDTTALKTYDTAKLEARRIAVSLGLEDRSPSPQLEQVPPSAQAPSPAVPVSPSPSEIAREDEHRQQILSTADSWFPNVEFLLRDILEEYSKAPITCPEEFIDRVCIWLTWLQENDTLKGHLVRNQEAISTMEAKNVRNENTIKQLRTALLQQEQDIKNKQQRATEMEAACTDLRRQNESLEQHLKLAQTAATATNSSLLKVKDKVSQLCQDMCTTVEKEVLETQEQLKSVTAEHPTRRHLSTTQSATGSPSDTTTLGNEATSTTPTGPAPSG